MVAGIRGQHRGLRGQVLCIFDAAQLVERVVGAGFGRGRGFAVAGFERPPQGAQVALRVVARLGGLVGTVDDAHFPEHTAECVELAAQQARAAASRRAVENLLTRDVAHAVERVAQLLAAGAGDGSQALCVVVAVGVCTADGCAAGACRVGSGAAGQDHLHQQAARVVGVAGAAPGHAARGEALAGVVGHRGGDAVGIDHGQQLTVGVVLGELRGVAQGVGDRLQVADAGVGGGSGVVCVGRGVGNVRAGAVGGQHLPKSVVGGRHGAHGWRGVASDAIANEGGKTRRTGPIGGRLLDTPAHHGDRRSVGQQGIGGRTGSDGVAVERVGAAVVDPGGDLAGLAAPRGQPPVGVPFGADFAAAGRQAGAAADHTAARSRTGQAFDAGGFKVAAGIEGVATAVAVVVVLAGDVAAGIARERLRRRAAATCGRAGFGRVHAARHAQGGGEAARAHRVQRVGDGGGGGHASAIDVVGERVALDATCVFSGGGAHAAVVAVGGEARGAFVFDAGQRMRGGTKQRARAGGSTIDACSFVIEIATGGGPRAQRCLHGAERVVGTVAVAVNQPLRVGHGADAGAGVISEVEFAAEGVGDAYHQARARCHRWQRGGIAVGEGDRLARRVNQRQQSACCVVGFDLVFGADDTPAGTRRSRANLEQAVVHIAVGHPHA